MLFLNFREQGFINKNPLRIIITALPYSGDEFLINQFKMIPGVYYQPFPFGKFKFHPISRPDIEDATEAAEYLLGTRPSINYVIKRADIIPIWKS